jgi:sigma-54 dependent transcriptional regulator, flagellar regulatory protein
MDYALVTDECEDCRYIVNAFTMLKLPLRQVTAKSLLDKTSKTAHPLIVIACKNVENKDRKIIVDYVKSNHAALISFHSSNSAAQYNQVPVCFLKMPFSNYELSNALSHCTIVKDHPEDFFDAEDPVFDKLAGHSPQIRRIKSMIKQVAASNSTVLILGQSGTGKDVIASCIHRLSDRSKNPFVPINCGAIPSELMESELFGHEKGAFTGALTRRQGRFEMANMGTLFLDEIGDMPMMMQVKLLRVIQDRTIERVGGNTSINVDVRLIAATNKNLEELIQQHQFREDLFYRLNVFPIDMPSLAERHEDIPFLIEYNLDKIYERLKHRVLFTERAKEILCAYQWPGNIRELQNFLERMVILHPDQVIDDKDIDKTYKQKAPVHATSSIKTPFNIKEYIANIERQVIQDVLEQSNGAVNVAAKHLSIGRNALLEKIKKYRLTNA